MSVRVHGKDYVVKKNKLDLHKKKIESISEIEGLDQLANLQVLILWGNKITEIKGLDALVNLKTLILGSQSHENLGNPITEIKGLDRLENLEELNLSYTPVT